MDESLRSLEKNWLESRHPNDDKLYLLALVKFGKLNRLRVAVAATLGHQGAVATGIGTIELPDHYRSRVETALESLTHDEAVSFGLECASRVLFAWELVRGKDKRPKSAIVATRQWLSRAIDIQALALAAKNASEAGVDADDPEMVPADERLTAAINAANAAAHAAYAAECAARLANNMEPLISGVAGCAAWTAGFATKAEADADSERKWQIETLCEYLLKRRETIDLRV